MRCARLLAVGLCSLVLVTGAFAQARPAAAAKTSEVLGLVPAGSMGVLVVNNVKATTDNLDKFLGDLGVPLSGSSLEMLLSQLEIEDGFRATGGFAAVMLDPQQFGIDLMAMIQSEITGEPMVLSDTASGDQTPPVAIYVPGKLKDLLAGHDVSKAGKHQKVDLNGTEVYVTELKNYVIFSPTPKVLDAIVASKKAIVATMTAEQSAAVVGSDLAVYFDMKICGPMLSKLLELQQQMMQRDANDAAEMIAAQFSNMMSQTQREALEQADSFMLSAKFVKEGLVFEEWIALTKGSDAAKANAELKPLGKGKELDRLPAKNYILAMDGMCASGEQTTKARDEFLAMLLSNDALDILSDADKTKLMGIIETMSTQVTRGQFVIGGSAGEGAFAATVVLQVKDSAKFTTAMKDTVKLINKLINDAIVAQFGEEAAAQVEVGLVYKAGASKSGTVSVDQISAVLPEGALDAAADTLAEVIGDSKIRFLLACPDKTTVVITLGGAEKQMTEALKTAVKGGGLDVSKAAVSGLKYMPENRNSLAVMHIANLMKGVAAVVPIMPFELKADAPLMFAGAASGTQYRVSIFVPTAAIEEIVGIVQMMTGGGRGDFGGDDDDEDYGDDEDYDDED